ncbi:MAG: hypothetical protein WC123_05045 [Bacilli bacterium]
MRQSTIDTAKYWAKTGTDILFTDENPFNGTVSKESLEEKLYCQILKNLVDHNTAEISEQQLQICINESTIN